ncbi:hypothetical protein JCM24511_04092 [Saitozyma sp. JCM 24511]|nr:hypothetical protein JCM24511_04092 [Saitozyma sp. JCM 24511]
MAKPSKAGPGPSTSASAPASTAGPNRPKGKVIPRTSDLLRRNESDKRKGKGKGKERDVLGGLMGMLDGKSMPGMVQVERFAETRAMEILAFQNAIKAAASFGNSRCFQSLPRHLRRRAASHNPRRVPKRMRSRAAAEIDPGDNIAKLHRKRAKLRAKGDLRGVSRTEQLLRRQKDKTWLPTHIWHAKRFRMINLWSHRLPLTPTLKSFRPAYRFARRKATITDVSYFGTIELEGGRDGLVDLLKRVYGGAFAGTKYESGGRVSRGWMYHPDRFPEGLIGEAEILWQPSSGPDPGRRVWIRLHPSIFSEVWDVLKLATRLQVDTSEQSSGSSSTGPVPFGGLQIRDLRSELDGFEITGPLAGKALRRVLRLCRSESGVKSKFFDALGSAQSSSEMPKGLVAGLKVYDPRLHFPPAPYSPDDAAQTAPDGILRTSVSLEPSADLALSDIWDSDTRDSVSKPRYKKSDLDLRRHRLGLPGTRLRAYAQDDRIPILLVQRSVRSGSAPNAHDADAEAFHGFTLIMPRGWSQYFLNSFAYAGCLVTALEERRAMYREAGRSCFPEHFGASCLAGLKWEEDKAREEERRWKRRPPGKRAEWDKLGTRWPFKPDWKAIISGCKSDAPDRDAPIDEEASINAAPALPSVSTTPTNSPWLLPDTFLPMLRPMSTTASPATQLVKAINAFRSQRALAPMPSSRAETIFDTAILHVRVEVLGRGSPGDMAEIHALDSEERGLWIDARKRDETVGKLTWDATAEPKTALQELGEITSASSSIIGWVITGNFSLSRGRGFGLAAVTLRGYIELLRVASGGPEDATGWAVVKVRNREGRVCRFARIEPV